MSLDETLDVDEDIGTAVSEDYKPPFKFTGKIEKVTIDLMPVSAVVQAEGDPVTERERVMRRARD